MKDHSPLTLADGDTYCVICGVLLSIKGFTANIDNKIFGLDCDGLRKVTLSHSWIIIDEENTPDGWVVLKCKKCGMLTDTPDCIPPTVFEDCDEHIMMEALL